MHNLVQGKVELEFESKWNKSETLQRNICLSKLSDQCATNQQNS